MIANVKQGDIIDVDLNGSCGCEIRNNEVTESRPCVIVQNNKGNKFSATTIVVPLTSQLPTKRYPTDVVIDLPNINMSGAKKSVACCSQIRTVDKSRLKKWRGAISETALEQVIQAILTGVSLRLN